jgi:hypothetical protein
MLWPRNTRTRIFSGMAALSKIIRWEVSEESALDRAFGSYI